MPQSLLKVAVGIGVVLFAVGVGITSLGITPGLPPPWGPRALDLMLRGESFHLDYHPGSINGGIKWQKGYSLVQILVVNPSNLPYTEINLQITPEYPIIESKIQSDLADCRMSFQAGGPTFAVATGPDGKIEAQSMDKRPEDQIITPTHRLYCGKLPAHSELKIYLATVMPAGMQSLDFYSPERHDPSFIDLVGSFISDTRHEIRGRMPLFVIGLPEPTEVPVTSPPATPYPSPAPPQPPADTSPQK